MTFGRDRALEFAPPDRIRQVQERLLRRHLAHCIELSPFYRRALRRAPPDPRRFRLSDLTALPLTTKADLAAHTRDFLAVPRARVVDIVLSSGTTGRPTPVMYTESDLNRLAYNEAISFAACGMRARDVVLLTCTMDRCFVAGLAYFLGVRRLGAAAIRNGLNSPESHAEIIRRMHPTAIVGVPSFLRKLALHLRAAGQPPDAAGVRRLVGIGEPLRDAQLALLPVGQDLERLWKAHAYSTYASSETVTTFCECTAQRGGHLHPDLAVVEILDDAGRPVPDGQPGEVVVTPLQTEGMPLLRFRTGDVSFLIPGRCACGRRSPRLGPILGRRQQMLKVRGTTLYPPAVFAALDEIPEVIEYYVVATSPTALSDDLTVHVAVRPGTLTAAQIEERLQARLRVKPAIVIEPETEVRHHVFRPELRKPMRFVDQRERS
jgi:phenylacetate-CoA ligase